MEWRSLVHYLTEEFMIQNLAEESFSEPAWKFDP